MGRTIGPGLSKHAQNLLNALAIERLVHYRDGAGEIRRDLGGVSRQETHRHALLATEPPRNFRSSPSVAQIDVHQRRIRMNAGGKLQRARQAFRDARNLMSCGLHEEFEIKCDEGFVFHEDQAQS